ncbi:hypothetical protein ACJRO7_029291 [Eucalyptus globulus]|uniref:High chlorophyll fluorescence 153 n=1 Tax=Eucalyptus globulus TaxID=34317 RepID=A0ABD3K4G4_EUCGL
MASLLPCFNCRNPSPSRPPPARAPLGPPHVRVSPPVVFPGAGGTPRRAGRGARLVAPAGPSGSSYVFAFVFPLSLLVVTVFASIKIADKLDRDFLEELAINQAIKDADEGDDAEVSLEDKPVLSRTRNRPKREA